MNFTIPSQAMLNLSNKPQPQLKMLPPASLQEVPVNPDPSSLDIKAQEVILSTSLRHLQHNFPPSPPQSLPPTTTLHNCTHSPSLSTQSSSPPPTPTIPQHSEWGTPHLLLNPPSSPTTSAPAMAQPPHSPPRGTKFMAKQPLVRSCKLLNMSSPACRRVSHWVAAIDTFLDMWHSKDKPEPAVAQKSSKDMMEAIKEVEEEKGLMSYDIILGTELYQTVWRLADANVNARKNQPSNIAKGVLECWEGRFPGMLPGQVNDGDVDMDVDT
ncbi:hypothetical protein LXA43DRAFT_599457 [Ganoderma leucocontextum]|nr:hypothetical protein LXA43DRAFT_599457 [Ganoderma leucocontextum]